MRSKYLVLFLVLCMLLSSTAFAAAQDAGPVEPLSPAPSAENGEMTNETAQLWFAELNSAPTADGGALAATQADKANFRKEAKNVKLQYTERYAFDTLWNGISVSVPASQVSKLAKMSTVKALYPVLPVSLPPTTSTAEPELFTAIEMTGAKIAQTELGLTGKGVKVAVMDTGIDIDHPDFGGTGVDDTTAFPSARIVAGYDFVGDAYNADPAGAYNPVPTPDNNPDDCGGHGSHVAGIVGANGQVKGVAPEVSFGAYRVFGCEGSTNSDIMIAAMERALADDMDILNMSIGSAFQWPQYPTAQAADRLQQKGVVVVASIGNSGANGLWSAGAPGLGKKVIGVASFDNKAITQFAFTISPDNKAIGYTSATGAPMTPQSGTGSLARTGTQASTADACAALPTGSLAGKIALIRAARAASTIRPSMPRTLAPSA